VFFSVGSYSESFQFVFVWSKCLSRPKCAPASPPRLIWWFIQTLSNRMKVEYRPEGCLATKTAKVVSRSNDYQKLIDLMTFCEALNRLASVASICAHSHHEGPQACSYEWHPQSSLISWAQPHIIEICRLFSLSFFHLFFVFFKDMSPPPPLVESLSLS